MKHLDDNVDVSGLEVERKQLKNQLKQVVGAKDKLQEKMDNLSVEDKHGYEILSEFKMNNQLASEDDYAYIATAING